MAELKLNRRNIDKGKTEITINSDYAGVSDLVITQYVNGISYEESQNVEFGYNLSNRPHQVGYGNIEGSGTLTVSDSGMLELDKEAKNAGYRDFMELGKALDVTITVEYEDYDGSVITDELEAVQFTNFQRGVESGTNLYNREINMMIVKINKNV